MNFKTMLSAAIAVTLGTLSMVGCQKDNTVDLSGYATTEHRHSTTQTQVYTLYINFKGAGLRLAESGIITSISKSTDDAVLIYMRTASAQDGSYYWAPLPYVDKNGYNFFYEVNDNGAMYFYADAGEGFQWTNNFSKTMRVVVIPHTVYTEMISKGINLNNIEDVLHIYSITDQQYKESNYPIN